MHPLTMPACLPTNALRTGLALLTLGLSTVASLAAPPQDIRFAPGSSGAEVKGRLKGDTDTDYRLVAGAGQTLSVELLASNASQNFNVFAPGSDEAMFSSASGGFKASLVLPTDGAYRIQTFLMRNAARRGEATQYTLKVAVSGAALPALPGTQDAKVPGTGFHATAQLPCKPPYAAATQCEAGVIRRGRDGTATVVIRGPNQLLRQILFVKGQPVTSNTTQAMKARREGDTTVVDIGGEERYDIPDVLLTGG